MNIHIEQHKADKPNLVLLHGWGTTSAIWQAWLPQLKENFSVTCIDLPGLGKSFSNKEHLSIEDTLSVLVEHIPAKSTLLGWSLGGVIAILLAQRLTDKVVRVITIASNPCFVSTDDWQNAMQKEIFEKFSKQLVSDQKEILAGFFKLQSLSGSEARPILKALKKIDSEADHSHLHDTLGLLNIDCRDSLKTLTIPSLHFYGQKDNLVPVILADILPEWSEYITTVAVPEAGHLPFLSDGQMISAEIAKFIGCIDGEVH
ncbi:MAG: alpha/beta fold hydrolase [Oceanospirillaceae bacterium]|nr:alpha/beta fold hydrolase [Oceanospirillaceae bacterium]